MYSPAMDTPYFKKPPKYVNAVLRSFPVVFIAYFILSGLYTGYFYMLMLCNYILFFKVSLLIASGKSIKVDAFDKIYYKL